MRYTIKHTFNIGADDFWKKVHFDPRRVRDPLYFRERGDTSYRPFTLAEFERLRVAFRAAEREQVLDR